MVALALPSESQSPAVSQSQHEWAIENEDCDLGVEDLPEQTIIGDVLGPKRLHTFRVININIQGIPLSRHHPKNRQFFRSLRRHEADIITIQELGTNWSLARGKDKWHDRLDVAFGRGQYKTILGYNIHDATGNRRQWGGTAIITLGRITQYVRGANVDPSGLGRWVWARFQGKDGVVLRVISIYRPCYSEASKVLSVYSQHKTYFNLTNDSRDPRAALLEDLGKEILKWKDSGDQILLCGDLNENIKGTTLTTFFESTHHLLNTIFSQHPSPVAPPTQISNTHGSAIDGAWSTPFLKPYKCGYLPFTLLPGGHANFFLDFWYEHSLGYHLPHALVRPHMRRLVLQNEKCTKSYLRKYRKLCIQHKLPQRQFALEAATSYPLTQAQQTEANSIDNLRTQSMLYADSRCRQIHTGAIQYSAAIRQPWRRIMFWRAALKRRNNARSINGRRFDRLKHSAGITNSIAHMTLAEIHSENNKAWKEYKAASKKDEDSRADFIETFPPKHRNRIKASEEARRKGAVARRVTNKLNGGAVTRVIKQVGDQLIDCETKGAIEQACIECNQNKYLMPYNHQTPFTVDPLKSIFGYLGNDAPVDQVLQGTFEPPEGTDQYTRKLLLEMKMPASIAALPPCSRHVATPNHVKAWKKARERTTGGPSELTFSMFKAHLLQ